MIARAIAAGSDPVGDLACRIGGEEFAVIFPDTDLADAEIVGTASGWRSRASSLNMRRTCTAS